MKKFYIILTTLFLMNGVIVGGDILPVAIETGANYDVKYYRCRWNIDPAVREISGNVTTYFVPKGLGLISLSFELTHVLTVESVLYHNNPVSWQHNSNFLNINFPSILPPQTVDSVTVYYHGTPPVDYSFVKSTHHGVPILWTLSAAYGAGNWWPCKSGLTDKADSIDIFIRTPSAYRTGTVGVLVSETTAGADKIYHWKHRYPIVTYAINLAVTNYVEFTQQVSFGGKTLNILNCVYPEDSATAVLQTEIIVPAIQFYDSLFGIYPFQDEKYGHAQYSTVGMETQTMSFVSNFSYNLLTHELAHQWFGNKITCGTWRDIWLNEGFAVYLTGLCYERFDPDNWKARREEQVRYITSLPGGSVYCTDTINQGRLFDTRLSYEKGAMVLHQLRWIIGDSAFFAALRNYVTDDRLVYGFARTADLKAHFESSSGQDLTWYFDDWYTGQGYPAYFVEWEQTGNAVTFKLDQIQSHPSVSFFELPVPVQLKNKSQDTIIRISNTFSGQSFTVDVPFTVDTIIIDPDVQLITGPYNIGAVADLSWQRNLQLFPNPVHTFLTVISEGFTGDLGYRIYTSDGRMVTNGIIDRRQQQINIMRLTDGAYTIMFQNGNHATTRTFIKTR